MYLTEEPNFYTLKEKKRACFFFFLCVLPLPFFYTEGWGNERFEQKKMKIEKVVLPGGYAFHKFSQNVTSFHKFSQHENRYKIVKAGEKW